MAANVFLIAPMIPYGIGTLIALVLTMFARSRDVTEAFWTVTASWVAWNGYILMRWGLYELGYGSPEAWYAGIIIDAMAAYALCRHPSNKIKATIGAVFLLQILIHMAYGGLRISHTLASEGIYKDYLSITGWIELLLLGGWSGGHAWRRLDLICWLVRTSRRITHHRDMGAS